MNETSPRRERRSSWPFAVALVFLILAGTAAFLFWRIESWPMRTAQQGTAELERLGKKARDAFLEIAQLQPRVTINNRVYFEQTNAVAELAILSRQTEVEHEFLHTWAGSTKRMKLHGTFNVKAGFDLRQNFNVDVRDKEIVVELPHATILAVEQRQVEVQAFENGLWNRISAADVEKEMAALPALAREKVSQSALTSEAETTLQQQLETRLGTERPVHLTFATEAVAKP